MKKPNNYKIKSRKLKLPILQWMLCLSILFAPFLTYAQKERTEIREGNERFEHGKYSDAETEYRKALEKNRGSYPGSYNLGGSLYKQEKYEEAIREFEQSSAKTTDKSKLSKSYHNLGNALVQTQKYDEAVNAYKQALKLNPSDDDTRYNLAYSQAMLKQQQQQQQQDGDNKDENKDQKKDQNKDQQNKQDNKEQQDNKQDQQQQEQDKQEQQKAEANQPKLSKEDAERILKALQNDEKELQEKLSKKEGQRIRTEKIW